MTISSLTREPTSKHVLLVLAGLSTWIQCGLSVVNFPVFRPRIHLLHFYYSEHLDLLSPID